jgi:uncharacterized protein CbrC (UPF0167 family)
LQSEPASLAIGSEYPYNLSVRCGIDYAFFAGHWWQADKPLPAPCPWCIADGSAAERFDANFTDAWGGPGDVPMPVLEEITRRTPGFSAWQQDRWLHHCDDGCAFLSVVGRKELAPYPDAIEVLLHEHDQFGPLRHDAGFALNHLACQLR